MSRIETAHGSVELVDGEWEASMRAWRLRTPGFQHLHAYQAGWADSLAHQRGVERAEVEREMEGEVVEIHRAQPTAGEHGGKPTTIRIRAEIPDSGHGPDVVERARNFYAEEGARLARALYDSLPGGTMDELLAEMFRNRASLFRVGFGREAEAERLSRTVEWLTDRVTWLTGLACRCEDAGSGWAKDASACPVHREETSSAPPSAPATHAIFPVYCPHPRRDRCCRLSLTWPPCDGERADRREKAARAAQQGSTT